MKLGGNTVLITGGATGIGFGMAKRFVRAGSQVILCGRREEALQAAQKELPGIQTIACDLSSEVDRKKLYEQATHSFPRLNVLVNNAGIQNRPPSLVQTQKWEEHRKELSINLEAPMHLSMMFIPHLMRQEAPAIINVSSGLAFAPLALMSTYCATKAALHSFTMSLRYQLASTPIKVVEVIPPAVNTDLGGKGLHTQGVPLEDFVEDAMKHLERGKLEFGFKTSEERRLASRQQLDEYFVVMNQNFKP